MNIDQIRMSDNTLPPYAFPGGYPIFYITTQGAILCPDCANEEDQDPDVRDDDPILAYIVNYEDPELICDNCNAWIECAYCD